jgi:pyrimidine-nucleoside phosphorylase
VGNALEVKEALETLRGGGPLDFREHCLVVAAHLLVLGGHAPNEKAAAELARGALDGGRAWQFFCKLVQAQGGDLRYVEQPDLLPKASLVEVIPAPRAGYLAGIHARTVGETAVRLGAGRAKKGDPVDHAVGIVVHHKVGDRVEQGQPLFTIHANQEERLAEARQALLQAHTWDDRPVPPLPLFYGQVT